MYKGKKSPIILWVKITVLTGCIQKRLPEADNVPDATRRQKLSNNKEPVSRRSNYQNYLSKMAEVDIIVDELEEKHGGGKFSPEQIRAWAHMIHLKKHMSYDEPPKNPFFKGTAPTTQGMSPVKRITLRSECIDQLEKWHKLMERGAISTEQYKDIQDTILNDIKKY